MQIDFSTDLAKLMIFTGETATAIRMYSAYSGGSPSTYLRRRASADQEAVELMFLSDALHHFSDIGIAIQKGDNAHIVNTAEGILRAFADYDNEQFRPRWGKPTFDAWAQTVRLEDAKEAIANIRDKAAAAVAG